MAIERDALEILGGVRHGKTLGSPVAVLVRNTEWPRWAEEMSPEPAPVKKAVTRPRARVMPISPACSSTAPTTPVTSWRGPRRGRPQPARWPVIWPRRFFGPWESRSSVMSSPSAMSRVKGPTPLPADLEAIDPSPVRCFHEPSASAMVELIEDAKERRDTLGGVFEVLGYGVPAGIGSHVHYDRRLDGMLAAGLMSIPGDQRGGDRRRFRGRLPPRLQVS